MTTKSKFIAKVRAIMNEVAMDDINTLALLESDKVLLEQTIGTTYTEAYREATNILPLYFFAQKDFSSSNVYSDLVHDCGYVQMPKYFLRLAEFKLIEWSTGVYDAFPADAHIMRRLHNKYSRPPMCVLGKEVILGNVVDVIYFSSISRGQIVRIEKAMYIASANDLNNFDDNYDINVSDNLFEPLAYIVASQVYDIMEKPQIAQTLMTKITAM